MRDAFSCVTPHDFDRRPPRVLSAPREYGPVSNATGHRKEFGTIGGRRGDVVVEVTTYRTDEYEIGRASLR